MAICLITGGAGFIGSHIVDALLARGDRVRVLDNLSSGHFENLSQAVDRIEFIEGDVRDEATVTKAVTDVDFIFHLAAIVSVPESMEKPAETEEVNTVGTVNLLKAGHEAGVKRLMFSSTCAVYGDEPTLPKIEIMQPQPKSPYAISKLAAEHYCRLFNESYGLETVIFRYFNIFGPRQDPSSAYSGVISIFVEKLSQDVSPFIFGDGEQTRDFVFIKDVVQANLLAMTETSQVTGKIFNIGTGQQTSVNKLFDNLRNILSSNLNPIYKPARNGDILHSYANPALAHSALGWKAKVQFEDGLRYLVNG